MSEEDMKAQVDAWLAETTQIALRDYLLRGRKLENIPSDDLADTWVDLVLEWADNPYEPPSTRRLDIESEFEMRSEKPPYDRVRDEFELLARTMTDNFDAMSKSEVRRVGDRLHDDMQDTMAKAKRQKN